MIFTLISTNQLRCDVLSTLHYICLYIYAYTVGVCVCVITTPAKRKRRVYFEISVAFKTRRLSTFKSSPRTAKVKSAPV